MNDNESDGPDLVIAGAGGGLVAALRAAQLGHSVLVVEADEHFQRGNNTSMSTAMIPGAGSRWQQEADVDDTPERFVADIMAKTHDQADPGLARALANLSPRLVEWLGDDLAFPISLVTDFPYPGHSKLRCHTLPGRSGHEIMALLMRQVRASELIDLLVPARLVDVVVADGSVEGVVVETPDGREEIPTGAVLLATNGFAADQELVQRYIPEIAGAIYHGGEYSVGDALRIGERLGAESGYLDAYQGHAALAYPSATLAGWATVMHGGFLVNRAGERYGDETIGYSEYARESLLHAGGESWMILDEEIRDACQDFSDFRDMESSGGIKWAHGVEELARVTGIDPQGLTETHTDVHGFACGEFEDPLGRTYWAKPLATSGRIGAIAVRPALFHTQGGLRVDGHARVLRPGGEPIGGLYASGGSAMGISGHGADGYLAGNGLLPAMGLAFLAAEHLHDTLPMS